MQVRRKGFSQKSKHVLGLLFESTDDRHCTPIRLISSGKFPKNHSGSQTPFCQVVCWLHSLYVKKGPECGETSQKMMSQSLTLADLRFLRCAHKNRLNVLYVFGSFLLQNFPFLSFEQAARDHFGCLKTAVVTRMGWRSGQTQSHLHDHLIGFDPKALHPWLYNYASEITGNKSPYLDSASLAETRRIWEPFFEM
jgi:hypothetical protein